MAAAQGLDQDGEAFAEAQVAALLALDCEMCETLPGMYELTRISVVNGKREVCPCPLQFFPLREHRPCSGCLYGPCVDGWVCRSLGLCTRASKRMVYAESTEAELVSVC